MKSQKRNLSQELESLLHGRSILDLTGEESDVATELLTNIVKTKTLKTLTKVEVQALVEELVEITTINMFNGSMPEDWKEKVIDKIKNCNKKEWDWNYSSILDYYLYNIELWRTLDVEEREAVAKTMLKYLDGEKDYYDYCAGYIEDYLDDEENG